MFNCHTHNVTQNAIVNIDGVSDFPLKKDVLYSIGNHPWYNQFSTHQIEQLLNKYPQIVAIGECGIDKVKHQLNIQQQIDILKTHIALSEKYQKPLILHVVKAFNEIIKLKKDINPKQAWIIHGFNSYKQTEPLIESGFYLSFGNTLLANQKLQFSFKNTPINYVFLETDDSKINIKKIYKFASHLKGINLSDFVTQIKKNRKVIFNIK